MSDEIRISGIVEESIVDGPGLRYVLFTQGCLAERLRAAGYNLTSYTGYLYEELLADSRHMPLLRQLDILVDGPFILEEKSLVIRFRGSRNQRIIDVPRSLAEGRVVLHPAMD